METRVENTMLDTWQQTASPNKHFCISVHVMQVKLYMISKTLIIQNEVALIQFYNLRFIIYKSIEYFSIEQKND